MRKLIKINTRSTVSVILLALFAVNTLAMIPSLSSPAESTLKKEGETQFQQGEYGDELDLTSRSQSELQNYTDNPELEPRYPSDFDLGNVLGDRDNQYREVYEPWKSKAALHSIAYHEETGFLAVGGGYLYDNEVHIFRLNPHTGKFVKVWDSGDSIIQSDVMSLAFGDTDVNNFLEIAAGSSDGHVYVFEQRHIYDPETNTENMFDHVWTSPSMFRVFDLKIEDVDRDYRPDIVAGTWEGIHLFEYDNHSGYPYSEEHWITYNHVWSSPELEDKKIYSIEAGDSNYNGLPEIIAGTRDGRRTLGGTRRATPERAARRRL